MILVEGLGAAPSKAPPRPAEETEVHTRILRLALGIEEARAYWASVDPSVPPGQRALQAFEQRWFGPKTLHRVRTLLPYLATRYDAFPEALAVLRRWRNMEPAARQVICHWHVQLSDPIYRRFTGQFLIERRELKDPKVDRPAVARWLRQSWPDRWSEATVLQFASKLLSAASEAGLVTPKRDPRELLFPKVPDVALAYLLYLLRDVRHDGSNTENPYLESVGLGGGVLDQRLRGSPSVTIRRMGALVELDWAHASLDDWAEATL
ncbi:MAG: DUF1819 domain-containing protein [Anaeromyxobacteraceae bacterium]